MKFILGLMFGMALTFSGAWFLAFAKDTKPAEQTVPQKMPEVVQQPAIEPPSSLRVEQPAPPVEEAPQAPLAAIDLPEQTAESELTAPLEHAEQGSESVWALFHSEASASGFANYLSHSIDHPFVVTKLGPAQYQVSYSYTDAEQAQALAAKINMITGTK
jgi:hypothetical protein